MQRSIETPERGLVGEHKHNLASVGLEITGAGRYIVYGVCRGFVSRRNKHQRVVAASGSRQQRPGRACGSVIVEIFGIEIPGHLNGAVVLPEYERHRHGITFGHGEAFAMHQHGAVGKALSREQHVVAGVKRHGRRHKLRQRSHLIVILQYWPAVLNLAQGEV